MKLNETILLIWKKNAFHVRTCLKTNSAQLIFNSSKLMIIDIIKVIITYILIPIVFSRLFLYITLECGLANGCY